jgi:nicotinamide riboside transporter PnuC
VGVESLWRYHGVDWVGICFSMLSTYYLGKKRKRGFILGMIGNVAFVVFGVMAGSAANVVANGTYLILNARGWWKWKEEPPQPESSEASGTRSHGRKQTQSARP